MRSVDLCLLGYFSANCHVGSMLGRAATSLGLSWMPVDLNYAKSLGTLPGKLFFRLSGGRPREWWKFNRQAAETILKAKPRLVLSTGVVPLHNRVFEACREVGAVIANFATDDPWADHMRRNTWFWRTIPRYDLIASTKPRVIPDFRAYGAKRVEYFPYAYDPFLHRPPDPVSPETRARFHTDLSFIGTGNPARRLELEHVACRVPGERLLFGNDWSRHLPNGWTLKGEALDNDFRLAAHEAKITIALLRRGARDDATMRTFELAPCDSCGVYEDTAEHRTILNGYPEIGFFKNLDELSEKCRTLLANPALQQELRIRGREIIATPEHAYAARLMSIAAWLELPLSQQHAK